MASDEDDDSGIEYGEFSPPSSQPIYQQLGELLPAVELRPVIAEPEVNVDVGVVDIEQPILVEPEEAENNIDGVAGMINGGDAMSE